MVDEGFSCITLVCPYQCMEVDIFNRIQITSFELATYASSLVSSPAPPSGLSERERRRVWEITQGGSIQRAEIPRQVLIMKVGLNYKVQNRSGGSLASQTR